MKKQLIWGLASFVCGLGLTANAALEDGLVLHYSFDAPASETVEDESGNGNYGILNGTSYEPSGRIGGAFSFNGTERIDVSNPYIIEPWVNPQYSVSIWFLSESDANFTDNNRLLGDNRRYEIIAGTDPAGRILYTFADSFADCCFGDPVATVPGSIPNDTWQHVVLTVDGVAPQSVRLYLNGELVATSLSSGANFGGYGLTIGSGFDYFSFMPGFYWIGLLDDVRIYNRVLTEAEIFELANPVIDDDDGGGDGDGGGLQGSVLSLAFSTSEDGEGDIADLTTSDTLYIRLVDAGLSTDDPDVSVEASVKKTTGKPKGNASNAKFDLLPQADGSFLGSISMSNFAAGELKVDIKASNGTHEKRRIMTYITLQ